MMQKIRPGLVILASFLSAFLCGCVNLGEGTREETRFYRLENVPPQPAPAGEEARPAALPEGLAFQIGPVRIPGYLKRSQIVTRSGPHEYRLAEFDRWAEPLDANIARVLAGDLKGRLGTSRIDLFPWKHPGSPDYQVMVEVLRFDGTLGEEVLLTARWSIIEPVKQEELMAQEASFQERPEGPNYSDLVAAMCRSLAGLSLDIAQGISTLAAERKL